MVHDQVVQSVMNSFNTHFGSGSSCYDTGASGTGSPEPKDEESD